MSNQSTNWEADVFTSCVKDLTSSKLKIPQSKFQRKGKYAIIDQGANFIAGYTDDPEKVYKDYLPVIIFGDHTRILKYIDFPFALGADGAKILVPDRNRLETKYLYYFLKHKSVRNHGYSRHYKFLKELTISFPPINVQKSIILILDRAEQLREWRKQSDKLTEQYLTSIFFKVFGDLYDNRNKFEIKKLNDLKQQGTIITYGIVQAGPNINDGIPYIKTGDIKNCSICQDNLSKTDRKIAQKYKRSEVHFGDLIYSIRATVGTVAILPKSLEGANLTQGTAKISPGPLLNSRYLFWYLRSQGCQKWVRSRMKGVTFKEITLKTLRETPILLPPREIQDKFADLCLEIENTKKLQVYTSIKINQLNGVIAQKLLRENKQC